MNKYYVYPTNGPCKVIRAIDKGNKSFIQLLILHNEMTLLVPKDNFDNVVRPIMSESDLKRVNGILAESNPDFSHSSWNVRYREYYEKLKNGGFIELAELVRDLTALKRQKDLSFGENKMLDCAELMLNSEIELIGKD